MLKRKTIPSAAAQSTPSTTSAAVTPNPINPVQTPNSNVNTTATPNLNTPSPAAPIKSPVTTASSAIASYNSARAEFNRVAKTKGYYSARAEQKTTMAIFDQFGRAQACPRCCTSKITQPGLELLYTTCCGSVLCSTCKDQVAVSPLLCDVPGCIGIIDRSTWSKMPVDEYRYDLECKKRRELGKLAALVEEDFAPGDRSSHDQYNEDLQSLLYDYTYGNPPLVADLAAVRSSMERKFAIQIQRHDAEMARRRAEEQEKFQQQQGAHQADLKATQNFTIEVLNSNGAIRDDVPPHFKELHDWYGHFRLMAMGCPLELHTLETWRAEWYNPRQREITAGFAEVEKPPATVEEMVEQHRAQAAAKNDGHGQSGADAASTAMSDGPDPNSAPVITSNQRNAFLRLKEMRENERRQRKMEEDAEMRAAQLDSSGFVDYSLLQVTRQYNNVIAALEYENNYGVEALGLKDWYG